MIAIRYFTQVVYNGKKSDQNVRRSVKIIGNYVMYMAHRKTKTKIKKKRKGKQKRKRRWRRGLFNVEYLAEMNNMKHSSQLRKVLRHLDEKSG